MIKKIKSPDDITDILIVEDSPTQVARIKYFLERNNYKTKDCQDGNQALSWLTDHKPSLIISDVLMPGMNGFELCERIKSDIHTKDIPVILLTTLTNTEEVINGLIAGADSFLTKPYDNEHLLSSIQMILEESGNGESREKESDLEIYYRGKKRIIRTGPQKVIKLLLNNYQGAIYQNEILRQTQEELRLLNEQLETIVKERTSALAKEIELSSKVTEQLRESEEKYRTMVETANEGIWKVDSDLNTTFVNEKMADMLGYTSREMIGRSALDFMDEEGKVRARKNFVRRKQGLKESFEQTFIRKDGTRIITFTTASPFQNSKGEFSGSVGLLTDITERKKVENALKESSEKLNLALENGNIGIWEWDIIRDKVFCDDRMGKMFGLKSGSFITTSQKFENYVHEEDRSILNEAVASNIPYETIFRTRPKERKIEIFQLKSISE